MKKKLLALLIALVALFTYSFVFSACDFINLNTNESDNEQSGNQPDAGSENAATLEEEWIKAVRNITSATSYKVTGTSTSEIIQKVGSYDIITTEISEVIIEYDNNIIHLIADTIAETSVLGQIMITQVLSEYYLDLSNPNIIVMYDKTYVNMYDKTYVKTIEEHDIESPWRKNVLENGIEAVIEQFGIDLSVSWAKVKVSKDSEAKSLDELYDAFNYDADNQTYTATLFIEKMNGVDDVEATLSLVFADGKVDGINLEVLDMPMYVFPDMDADSVSSSVNYYRSDFNTITVTIPDEVKNTAQD